mmetsp:Transcript_21035/g.58376  ORF Transcript_21035/g.58376 Transcript_21035/m.58376 type:complete len:260 (-) Transcript_21035:1957-2736(-)
MAASCSASCSLAALRASGTLLASFPPAWARFGRPPPPPPQIRAMPPINFPACRPPATTSAPKAATIPTLPSAEGEISTTAAFSPSCFWRLAAAPCRSPAATPSRPSTSRVAPLLLTASALEVSAAVFARAIWDLRLATSAAEDFSSSCSASTLSTTAAGLTLNLPDSSLTMPSTLPRYSTWAAPATASMRRTPEAIPPSEIILKPPISAVLETCVPPQSSMLRPGTSTTLTTSPYFSPNMAVAPASCASVMGIVLTCSC